MQFWGLMVSLNLLLHYSYWVLFIFKNFLSVPQDRRLKAKFLNLILPTLHNLALPWPPHFKTCYFPTQMCHPSEMSPCLLKSPCLFSAPRPFGTTSRCQGCPFPPPSTHPNSSHRIMQYPWGKKHPNWHLLQGQLKIPLSLKAISYCPGPCSVSPVSLGSKIWYHAYFVLFRGAGDAVLNNTNMVSALWNLPFSSLSLNFYRSCLESIHFGYLIVYCLHSYFKLYVLYIFISKYCCEKLVRSESSEIYYTYSKCQMSLLLLCFVFSFSCIFFNLKISD